ncbi:MAG: [FeFe] hydrogenase H-cluster radical SAM maturase HydE [Candidatus Moranbacteria bacterium]|nr:[FeFe] hydrogenase H-cluster radical SAM maturase HydE [Candidatus Moranbacteria bacterium]
MNDSQIKNWLLATDKDQQNLFKKACSVKEKTFGKRVWFRGIIEFSNICQNNCLYCGIRKGNKKQERFKMSPDEILSCLKFIDKADYGSVVYQSGEMTSNSFKNYLLEIVRLAHQNFPNLGITISCGEQDFEFLKALKEAGATRYLLRIETSNPKLYAKLHPAEMSWEKRFQCLKDLQKLDYQVGTGVMIGLPDQTIEDLINDLHFFVENKFDMFGIGPYVIHEDTPLSNDSEVQRWWHKNKSRNFNLSLNFLAVLRILQPNANIAAATACDVLSPLGRMKVLQIAGNVIMPSVTPQNYRNKYLLYENKPCIDENAEKCFYCLNQKIVRAGLRPIFGEQGNSPFFYQRKNV